MPATMAVVKPLHPQPLRTSGACSRVHLGSFWDFEPPGQQCVLEAQVQAEVGRLCNVDL